MIIGINGKIGSGKDTVGRIIQYLTSEYRDKYSFVEWRDRVENYDSNTYSPWKIKKFAGKLKETASLLTGVPAYKFEDQDFKKLDMKPEWGMTYREFLQKLGTEAMRNGLHTNVWVNALFADYKPKPNKAVAEFLAAEGLPQSMNAGQTEFPNWIITDMRFPNEMEAIVEKGGITIRVVREFYEFSNNQHEWRDREDREGNVFIANPDTYSKEESNKKWRNALKERAHASETALDDHTMHYEIINDGTIEDLIEKVKEILIERNII